VKNTDIHENQFTRTKWDGPDAKMKYARRLCRFLERNCPKKSWNKAFYNRLSQMFGFIAHYNALGFWEERLSSPQRRLATLQVILRHPCYGDPAWTWSDVEKAVQAFVRANGLLAQYETAALQAAQESA